MSEQTIRVEQLNKTFLVPERDAGLRAAAKSLFRRRHREVRAVDDITFEIGQGEIVGFLGPNGAGKSTLLKILTKITWPTSGRAEIRGRVGSLLEVGTGFHPELTGRENIYLNGAILGMRRSEINRKIDDIIGFSGVERFMDTPVKRYSSGMFVRLAFSVAAHFEPDIMVVDEVLAVGDADFQRRSLGRMESLGDSGRTVLFVSHNLHAVLQLCDRAILLQNGQIVREGTTHDVVAYYEEQTVGGGPRASWPEGEAPGDDLAELRSVRVVDEEGGTAGTIDVRRPIGIEIAFRVLREGRAVVPKIKVLDQHGAICFNALDVDPRWSDPSSPGDYVATAWIPPNLLNEGRHSVDVNIVTVASPKLIPHASAYKIVAFHVFDPAEGDSARGLFGGEFRGVVRPLLEWTYDEG